VARLGRLPLRTRGSSLSAFRSTRRASFRVLRSGKPGSFHGQTELCFWAWSNMPPTPTPPLPASELPAPPVASVGGDRKGGPSLAGEEPLAAAKKALSAGCNWAASPAASGSWAGGGARRSPAPGPRRPRVRADRAARTGPDTGATPAREQSDRVPRVTADACQPPDRICLPPREEKWRTCRCKHRRWELVATYSWRHRRRLTAEAVRRFSTDLG
jgi:hypothetical protein